MAQNSKWLIRVILDLLSLILVFFPSRILNSGIEPYHRGFYCNDNSIKYPYKGNTITITVLDLVCYLLPPLIFVITELIWWKLNRKQGSEPAPHKICCLNFPHILITFYKLITVFLFGIIVQNTIKDIGKFSIGRLRPHFIELCQPNYAEINCTDAQGHFQYITKDVCQGTDENGLKNARLSFPSGHASMSTYAATFIILYLQARMTWQYGRLFRAVLQCILGNMAIFTCLSRISDYHHHWTDVLAGAVMGVFVGALVGCHVSSFFKSAGVTGLLKSIQNSVSSKPFGCTIASQADENSSKCSTCMYGTDTTAVDMEGRHHTSISPDPNQRNWSYQGHTTKP